MKTFPLCSLLQDPHAPTTNSANHQILIVSGGFAIVQPGSQLSINAVEGFPLEDFSSEVNTVAAPQVRRSLRIPSRLFVLRSQKLKRLLAEVGANRM